jgi:hypothetical protein
VTTSLAPVHETAEDAVLVEGLVVPSRSQMTPSPKKIATKRAACAITPGTRNAR